MRVALLLAALLAGCAPREAATCDVRAEHSVSFSDAASADKVTARAIGPSCDRTIALMVIESPSGHPIWSWTAPTSRAFGAQFDEADTEALEGFVARWAELTAETASAAPAWPLPETAATTLDRATYEDIRARDLPTLCHLTSVARETCIFWEPGAANAGVLYERDSAIAAAPADAPTMEGETL